MMRKIFALLLTLSAVASAQFASAASYTLTPTVVASLADDGTFATVIPIDVINTNGVPRIFQVDFLITTSDVQAGELGFALTGFNVGLSGGLTDVGGGWGPNTATVDSNGALPGGVVPLFATNVDGGTPGDLLGILTSIAGGVTNGAVDPRANVGKTAPALAGTVFVRWAADGLSTLNTNGVLFTTNSTTGQFLVPASPGAGAELVFGIPEPATCAMAGMGLIGMVAIGLRRKKA